MLTFDFSEVERAARSFEDAARQVPFVMSFALTNAMKDARTAEVETMGSVFDRPTRYTLNSLQVVPATKTNLRAELRPKEFGGRPAWKYLGPEIEGGPRRHKGFERALIARGLLRSNEYVVPSENLKLDANGNVPGSVITQILSALGASRDGHQNTTKKSAKRKREYNRSYVVIRGRGQDGIYIRQGRFRVLVMLFVGAPKYSPRFPFYERAREVVPAAFNKHFLLGWERFVLKDFKRR